jgi:hypothetical protein
VTFSTKKYTVSPAHLRRQCKSVLIIYDDGIDLIFAHIEFLDALPLLTDMAEPFGVAHTIVIVATIKTTLMDSTLSVCNVRG